MKKLFYLLVVSVLVVVPMSVKAASAGPAGPLGVIVECDKAQRVCTDKCVQTCTIEVTKNPSGLSGFKGTLTLNTTDAKIIKIDAHEDWIDASGSLSGNDVAIAFTPLNGKYTEKSFKIATFQVELKDNATDCSVNLKYEVDEQKIDVTTTTTVTKTGASLPIVIIACGIGAVAVIYLATKKSKKMFKI